MTDEAFYDERDGLFHPTLATVGPWDPKLQHGSPPAALLATLLDVHDGREGTRLAQFSLDFMGPVPLLPMKVDVETLRPGKKIALSQAIASIGGRPSLRACAWRVAIEADRNPDVNLTSPPPPRTGEVASEFFEGIHDFGYAHALEWRFTEGDFVKHGPATVWTRLGAQVVRGKAPSALARVLSMVDSANGISAELDARRYLFVPVNLTVSLARAPAGEWFAMHAVTSLAREGTGTTRAELWDESGPIGWALQTLFVEKRA
jgi:hypothetical protein